jgi:16S rRNA (guanine527-N7)-methyltransferase
LTITDELSQQLWSYTDLLFRWNQKINLTSLNLDKPDEAIDRLLLEPLLATRHVSSSSSAVIDIGSGGGSPAIPLKLALPGIRLVMVESKARKSAFLREALRQLRLDATVETERFEELLARPDLHEAFDLLTVRAVRTEPRTLMSLQAFVRQGGRLFLFKGVPATGEAQARSVPPLSLEATHALGPQASLIVLEKLAIP